MPGWDLTFSAPKSVSILYGAFAALIGRLGAVELVENRRQVEHWERAVLEQLRTGEGGQQGVSEILAAYHDHGRLHVGVSPATVRRLRDRFLDRCGIAEGGDVEAVRLETADDDGRTDALANQTVHDGTSSVEAGLDNPPL